MKNLTFIEHVIEKGNLKGCIVLADYIWNPENENTEFYDFAYCLLGEIFKDYNKKYNATETLLDAIQEVVYVSRTIKRHAEKQGEKEREERQTNSLIFEWERL